MNVTLETYCQFTQDYYDMVKRQDPLYKEANIFEKAQREYNELYRNRDQPRAEPEDTELMVKWNQRITHLQHKAGQIFFEFADKYPTGRTLYSQENVLKFLHLICGGEEHYNALPLLDIKKADEQLTDHHEFIKSLPPMHAAVMRGVDRLKRVFIAIRARDESDHRGTFAIFQRFEHYGFKNTTYEKVGPVVCRHTCRHTNCDDRLKDAELFKKVHELITTGKTTHFCGFSGNRTLKTYTLGGTP